ncbi:alpha-2-macroglobulin [Acetobacteraceae bacterium H6797]|nr:alpha-2-macroglobulin [Acetobacteraceae bacterium H6797]
MLRPLFGLLGLLAASPVLAQTATPPAAPPVLDQAQRADGATVIPDRFLRRWDPVTVLFDRDQGPAKGGPEDEPERLVTMSPAIPGAWNWLGPRALQFRPTEPWNPLRRVTFTVDGKRTELVPLLPAPVRTSPGPDDEGSADLDTITLTFPDPVDPAALARLLTIELRPLPGTATAAAETLAAGDFRIQTVERAARDAEASYRVVLNRPLPDGRIAILRLALSDVPGLDEQSFELRLRSAAPFALTDIACANGFYRETADGLLRCQPDRDGARRGLTLRFSADVTAPDILTARQALRITPPVEDLRVTSGGRSWQVTGRFQADTAYSLDLLPAGIKDRKGRVLSAAGPSLRFAFVADQPSLRWGAGQGLVERMGPQMVPLRGHGYDRADLRIHAIDPLGRDFWPFPPNGLVTNDDASPPLPGNEPTPWTGAEALRRNALAARLRALGSPPVSELVKLPITRGGADARFGLDIAPLLGRIAGPQQPGTYLLGLRAVDGGERRWMRVQVTDLVLTTVEEAERVRFAVTSLSTARPVEGAEIRVEGLSGDNFTTLLRGVTAADGSFTWTAPPGSTPQRLRRELRRITVLKGNDVLVLDPDRNPRVYGAEGWARAEEPWLGWTQQDVSDRREAPQLLCHIFTERPIYRPEDPVHIQGFIRNYAGGALNFSRTKGRVTIDGPDDQHWEIDITPDENGGFHHLFDEKTDATGDYTLRFTTGGDEDEKVCGEMSFRKEAYRLPSFEVLLNTPQSPSARVPLDAPFSVDLLARYFAGGLAAGRPITWRVRQFPEPWSPPGREGFRFSTDSRYSGEREFRSSPVLNREARTDDGGAARLDLDPTIEPTAQPRRYVVEATVTGDDDIQVRSVQNVVALPPFVLGMRLPRYLPQTGAIDGEALVVDAEGKPLPGIEYTATLIRRRWNSVLQASDFSQGAARYVTEVADEVVETRKLTSGTDVAALHFDAAEAGVYLVELAAEDKLGRRQSLKLDLFMAGDTPVTWSRPPAETVKLSTERDAYAPGETATLLIQSPFQTARALVVTEEPEGRFRYDWADIANGFGRAAVPIRKEQMPRVAVHVLLMRGRLPGPQPSATAPFDQGKPVTLAATQWITVTPVQHRVTVALEAPQSARPGQEIDVVLRLSDENGKPLAGEAAFWMVDQAVLTLAREQPLDPLPSFIVDRPIKMAARDTRNMAFGLIALQENPGGDEAAEDQWGQENISVRRNFTPVPVYMPRVRVGADGVARFKVRLPDTLTVFRMRAKAISGPSRFGFGTGEVRVRQAIVAQPALPRFLRPGDRFEAAVIGRVVEGPGGAGQARLVAPGLTLGGAAEQAFSWVQNRPARVGFPVAVPDNASGEAKIGFQIRRGADGAGDALELSLPIRPDRPVVRERNILALAPNSSLAIPGPAQPARPGTLGGQLALASDPALVRMLGGMNFLLAEPFGGTEQRIALAGAEIALSPFAPLLQAAGIERRMAADVRATARAIQLASAGDGLVAFWPNTRGSVFLTAAAYRFLTAAAKAGQTVDEAQTNRLAEVLIRALRSDYPRLLRGEELRERVAALVALAEAGKLQPAYAAELARRAALMPTETLAQATAAIALLPESDRAMLPGMLETLWSRVRLLNRNGQPVYDGLAGLGGNALILPSETRSLSEVVLAVARAAPEDTRLPVLREGLMRLGDGNGFGSTNATAAALRALAASWAPPGAAVPVRVTLPDGPRDGTLNAETPVVRWPLAEGAVEVANRGGQPALALAERRYVPVQPGAEAPAVQQGFVLGTALFRIRPNAPPERLAPGPDGVIHVAAGDIVEMQAELVNPEDRVHVAMTLPIAAGFEPLNPNLATAPAEAAPSAAPSPAPDWASYGDDAVTAVYTTLPRGNHRLAFRLRAQVAGSFTQPPGEAVMLYRPGVEGSSAGARVEIAP